MKKLILVLLAVSLFMPLFAGGGAEKSDGKTQLTYWALATRKDLLDVLAKEYNAANTDVEIVMSYYSTDGIKDALKVAASSGTLPDMWFNFGGSLAGFYAQNNLVYDLTAYAAENNLNKIYSPGALQLCTLYGKLAGLPSSFNVLSVYYRKDIFAKYNLQVPTTLEEFEAVCETLKANGVTPISTGGLNGWHTMRTVEQLIEHYAGAELHNKMNGFEESYNNEAVVKALTKYKEFCDKGYFPANFVTQDPDDRIPFYTGQTAMNIEGQWFDGLLLQEEQDINKYGSFPFPSGETSRLSAFCDMTQFNANLTSDELAAAVKFIDFTFNDDAVERFSQFYSFPLPRIGAAMPQGQPNVPVTLAASNANGTFTITDQAFPTEVADELFRVQDGIALNQVTPAEGAARIQAAIESYVAKN